MVPLPLLRFRHPLWRVMEVFAVAFVAVAALARKGYRDQLNASRDASISDLEVLSEPKARQPRTLLDERHGDVYPMVPR